MNRRARPNYRKHDAFYRRVAKSWGKRAAVIMTNCKRARDFNETRQWQSQSQAQTQTEGVEQKAESYEQNQEPVQKPEQIPVTESVEPKIKPHQILPPAPKKQSRGIRV